MANLVINEDGMIVGGLCDQAHQRRALREKGAEMYLEELKSRGYLDSRYGWLRITQLPEISEKEIMELGSKFGTDVKIGYIRFKKDIAENLFYEGRAFRMTQLKTWLEDIAALEFAAVPRDPNNPLAILDLLNGDKEAVSFGYASPHEDALYRKRKARGDF